MLLAARFSRATTYHPHSGDLMPYGQKEWSPSTYGFVLAGALVLALKPATYSTPASTVRQATGTRWFKGNTHTHTTQQRRRQHARTTSRAGIASTAISSSS